MRALHGYIGDGEKKSLRAILKINDLNRDLNHIRDSERTAVPAFCQHAVDAVNILAIEVLNEKFKVD